MIQKQKMSTCLWFDNEAEEAANFYVSAFKNSKILKVVKYNVDTPSNKPIGSVMTVEFEIEGMNFLALNGGPYFTFSEAISFIINCEDQAEVDELWGKLSHDPKSEQCGWLKDKYGLSWQIVPKQFDELANDPDPKKAKAVMTAMMQMKKLDINQLKAAHDNA